MGCCQSNEEEVRMVDPPRPRPAAATPIQQGILKSVQEEDSAQKKSARFQEHVEVVEIIKAHTKPVSFYRAELAALHSSDFSDDDASFVPLPPRLRARSVCTPPTTSRTPSPAPTTAGRAPLPPTTGRRLTASQLRKAAEQNWHFNEEVEERCLTPTGTGS